MVFLKSEWGLHYYGEVKEIVDRKITFIYDDSVLYTNDADVFVVCPD